MKKILFLIHDLGPGGAEKVLVNLVNNMSREKFDITVMSVFGGGVNEQFLGEHIRYKTVHNRCFPGNSHLMKLLTPRQLHKLYIKEHYDIEVAYLEGPCARIISGCPHEDTRLVSWIHIEQKTVKRAAGSFRSIREAEACYNRFHQIVTVSQTVKEDFTGLLRITAPCCVRYNTNESEKILAKSREPVEPGLMKENEIKLVGIGKLLKSKGFDRLLCIERRLLEEGYPVHLYILGIGPEEEALRRYIRENAMEDRATLLGYQTNPYKYTASCDLFLCASFAEGFSTAATEALIVGTPVCTVEVSGMKEMLGQNNEYGIVTDNTEEALYRGVKRLLDEPGLLEHYKKQAEIRGRAFSTAETTGAVEKMLLEL